MFRWFVRSGSAQQLTAKIENAHDLAEAGRDTDAATLCDEILAAHPDHPQVLHLKGVLALRAGNPLAARDLIAQAIAGEPAAFLYRFNLGNALTMTGEIEAAATAFGDAVRLRPDHAPSWFNLGKAQLELKRHEDAIASLSRLSALQPADAAVIVELGTAWYARAGATRQLADYARVIEVLGHALVQPSLTPELKNNALLFIGDSLHNCRRHSEALQRFQEVLAGDPGNLDALVKTANCLNQLGRMAEALPYFRQVAAQQPDHLAVLSSIISVADYLPEVDADANTRQRLEIATRLATPERRTAWPNSRDPGRRLRIGYVSPNLRTHVAMYLFEAVLRLHDRHDFDWFVYDATPDRDEKSAALRSLVPNWRPIDTQPVTSLPAMIERDQIDILVDLAGHTSNNRLMSFAYKPAPVQVSWLAYPGSTGMQEIDYLISDAHTTPPHLEHHASETVWRLPATRFSYEPPAACAAPALPPPPQPVTFGCFNNIAKLNSAVFALWRRVLEAVPDARLVIKSSAVDDSGGRAMLSAGLQSAGLPLERIELRGITSYLDNFASYGQIHIALDPFPFCGGLTSLDALWMGVPVVTLEQELMAGRQTLAFLHHIGHPELIAATPDDYVRIAVNLARDPAAIARYRSGLREAMRASPLLDHAALTRNLEAAYRAMWRRYCAEAA